MFFEEIGRITFFLVDIFKSTSKIFKRKYEIFKQINKIGVNSILLVTVTSAFTGFVTAVQASYQTKGFIPINMVGIVVGKTTMLELAPVLTGLVLAGKVGASLTAEIGTMKVSEQIDALKSIAVNPYEYLYMPRIIAGTISFPILTILSNLVALLSAFLLSHYMYEVSYNSFFSGMKDFFKFWDLMGGILKSLFFGFFVTVIACYLGDKTKGGAEGVGKSTTLTVIASSIIILILDFIIASVLFGG